MSDLEAVKKALEMPNKIVFSCDDNGGNIAVSGDLGKLRVVMCQALVTNPTMYDFMFRLVNEAMSEKSRVKQG